MLIVSANPYRDYRFPGEMRFLEIQGIVAEQFRPKRHLLRAASYRRERDRRFRVWQEMKHAVAAA